MMKTYALAIGIEINNYITLHYITESHLVYANYNIK